MSNILKVKEYQIEEFKKIYEENNKEVYAYLNENLERVYQYLFAISLLANRVELKGKFSSNYFVVSFSCLLEAYILIWENRVRASCLVLRTSIENFIKHIILIMSESSPIDDRVFNKNKAELDRILNRMKCDYFSKEGQRINTFFENEYGKLSGLSHSLTPSSIDNIAKCVMDLKKVNLDRISAALDGLEDTTRCMFILMIISCNDDLRKWDSSYLEEIFRLVLGNRRTSTLIRTIKQAY